MFWLTIYTSLSSQHIRHFTQLKHETALVKVQNDILRALDSRHSLILPLLDLSAAFNAVEHSILLSRLSTSFVIRGTVLSLFRTYVTSRKQYVCLEGCKSSLRSLDRGVPQTSPLGKIIRRHNLQYHLYANNSQLYVSFKTESSDDLYLAKSKVELCVWDIDTWMLHNQNKSELLFSPRSSVLHLSWTLLQWKTYFNGA